MVKVENACKIEKDFCNSCSSHFAKIRPHIKDVIISKHFERDIKNEDELNSIIKDVLDCSHAEFHELHKFEDNIEGILIFRARKENLHILYCIDKNMRIIFLRAIRNFDEYKRLLDDKKELKKIIRIV
ncbi:MAG: hypothetical protein ABIE55_01305 [Candidatus Aenigmatarchaeota archaeon]